MREHQSDRDAQRDSQRDDGYQEAEQGRIQRHPADRLWEFSAEFFGRDCSFAVFEVPTARFHEPADGVLSPGLRVQRREQPSVRSDDVQGTLWSRVS